MKVPARFSVLIGIVVTMLGNWACTPLLYIPGNLNMPLPEAKKDLVIDGTVGFDRWNAQVSYAVESNVVLCTDYTYSHNNINLNNGSYNIAGGYYCHFGKKYEFELLGGFGEGYANKEAFTQVIDLPRDHRDFNMMHGQYTRIHLQADIGSRNPHIAYGLGLRISSLYPSGTYKVNRLFVKIPDDSTSTIDDIDFKNNNLLLLEPGFQLTTGRNLVRFHLSTGLSFILAGSHLYDSHPNLLENFYISAGIAFKIKLGKGKS